MTSSWPLMLSIVAMMMMMMMMMMMNTIMMMMTLLLLLLLLLFFPFDDALITESLGQSEPGHKYTRITNLIRHILIYDHCIMNHTPRVSVCVFVCVCVLVCVCARALVRVCVCAVVS